MLSRDWHRSPHCCIRGSHGSNGVCLGLHWCRSLPCPQTATQGCTGPSLRFLSKNEFTPPPKGGRGWVSSFSDFSRKLTRATAVHNRPMLAQRGLFGTSLVFAFPYSTLKTEHRLSQGRVWASTFLSGTVFGQHRKFRSSVCSTASWMGRIV